MSIPTPSVPESLHIYGPELAFSADGSKLAMAMTLGRVWIWDIQSKTPLKTFMDSEVRKSSYDRRVRYLQFSSGNLGKEVLVFVEVCLMFTF